MTLVGVANLTRTAAVVAVETVQAVPAYIGAALAYLLLTLPTGQLVGWLERRFAIKR